MGSSVIGTLMQLLKLRNLIIFSLILQCTLLLLSPLRKKIAAPSAITSLWVLHTVTTLAADYAIGLIITTASINPTAANPLISLWAQFCFLHVAGPDTVTAFSFEDTSFWFRTTFRLFLTNIAANFATDLLFPRTSTLAVVAVFICFVGALKFYETARCFFIGNLTRFRTFTKPALDVDVRLRHGDADVASTRVAFLFFQTYKGVFANVVFSPQQCSFSREYFLRGVLSAEEAFEVAETELNFVYDVLYTKRLVFTSGTGRVFRLVSVLLEIVAFFVWVSVDKIGSGFDEVDVRITYTLFFFAMVSEIIFCLIHLLSDWTIGSSEEESFWVTLMHKFILFKKRFGLLSRRWSESLSRCNLIMWCTSKSSPKVEKVLGWLKIKELVYGFRNMSPTRFDKRLRDLIFNELKYRSLKAESLQVAIDMSSGRGDWILRDYYYDGNASVLRLMESMEFYNIILLWHVATELCYNVYGFDNDDQELREYSKVMSDYMVYLLVREETMLSEVASEAKATFQHTCDEVVKMVNIVGELEGLKGKEEKVEKACRMIMANRDHEVERGDDHGIDGKKNSVLEDARILSKELKGMADRGIKMWEVMSKVWVELLCYAASSCKASEHAAQLCKGGQLLTIVWLLMAHMGLSNRFEHPK